MPHIYVSYEPGDAQFASQLAIQLEQRGLMLWNVADPSSPTAAPAQNPPNGLEDASHVLAVLTLTALANPMRVDEWRKALTQRKHVIVIMRETCSIPEFFADLPLIDFRKQYLLAVEDLVEYLKKTNGPTRQLTFEFPVVNADLLPHSLPAERCWREFRLRVHYRLPAIVSADMLMVLLPEFFDHTGLRLVETNFRTNPPSIVAERSSRFFTPFDPRRAQHTLTIEPDEGAVRVYYQTVRSQVRFWFPAHYHVLDREAAALYRYLVTQKIDTLLEPVEQQVRTAIIVSWSATIMFLVAVVALGYLILDEISGIGLL